jgi:hypothetical protein
MAVVSLLAALEFQWIVWPALAVVFCLGLLATFSPGRFSALAMRGGKWIDTERMLEFLDKPIDVDKHVLRYSRLFGVLVAAAALLLGWIYWTEFVAR